MPVQLGPTPEPGLGRELFASGGSGPASLLLLLHHPSPEDPTGAPALLACAPRAGPAGDSPGVRYLNKANRNARKTTLNIGASGAKYIWAKMPTRCRRGPTR